MPHGIAPVVVLVLLAGPIAASESWAAEDSQGAAKDDGPLATVVVTGVVPQSPLTFVTDPKLPRQPVPASDGADYLKTIPGFGAIRNGGTNGDPVLRGMFGSRLNILTNDGSMPGACPARMDNPLSYVSPETYDRLVVTKGPQTVLWGPGASAGTIRFERDANAARFDEPGLRLNANALAGSFGRNDQVLDLIGGASAGYARLSANRSEADDYQDGAGRTVPSSWDKWNADAALGWTPSDGTLLEFSAGAGDGEARYAGRGMDGSQFERTSYALRFEKTGLTGTLKEVTANVFYNYADHVMDNYTLREPNPMSAMPMPMASNVDRRTTGGRVAARWQVANLELTAGADTQDSRHRKRTGRGRNTYQLQPWSTDADLSNAGVFAELSWRAHEDGRTVFGGRVDRAEVTDKRQTVGMMQMPNPTGGETRSETLASGFVRYEHDARAAPITWFAGVGHAERMPDYWELFSPNMGPMGSVNAFSALQPERTTQLDAGLEFRTTRMQAWASIYAGRVDDFILFTYTSGGMMGSISSVDQVDAQIRGGETGVEIRLLPRWKAGATVAYSWAENRDTGTALPQIPPLDARFTLAYDNSRWSAGILLRAVDGQSRVAPGQGNVVGQDLGKTGGFAVLSMNGSYRISSQVSLAAGIDNLLDRSYAEHLNLAGSADFGYPADPVRIHEPGRTAWLKLVWNAKGL
ncbi:MAG TPA: TonB-dependent copper receptor [Steroidobacter sp.]|uniref:TonB-dependent copper receptor n=1 Tax=Steroidobacter sp. TaxID=1978227 RepID=UPI002EDAA67E